MNNRDNDGNDIRERFIESGLKTFSKQDVLELLLFYCMPRKKIHEASERIMKRFANLFNVFEADMEVLQEIDDLSKNAIVFLRMIPQLCKEYYKDQYDVKRFTSYEDMAKFAIVEYLGEVYEKLKVIYLDDNCGCIACVDISTSDSVNSVSVNSNKIIQLAAKYNSSYIILMHNHPHTDVIPSLADILATKALMEVCKDVDIKVIDHIIVSNTKTMSMRIHGDLK